jgi:hypothetical protein
MIARCLGLQPKIWSLAIVAFYSDHFDSVSVTNFEENTKIPAFTADSKTLSPVLLTGLAVENAENGEWGAWHRLGRGLLLSGCRHHMRFIVVDLGSGC